MGAVKDKGFLLCVMLAIFSISCEYGITRPASHSLLLTHFSANIIPWIWLATVPFNLIIVSLYNRYLSRIGPLVMLGTVAGLTVFINTISPFIVSSCPEWILFQFAWKDIYILLMFKQVWSLIHSSSLAGRAKVLYGLIYATGTVGAILGSLVPGFLAVELGSAKLFLFTLPIYLVLFLGYRKALNLQQGTISSDTLRELRDTSQASTGFAVIRRSPFLIAVLGLVLLMQTLVGLMEFQFSSYLALEIPSLDLRTEYMGRVLSLTNLGSGVLQLVGAGFLIHFFGVRGSHLAVPLVLLANVAGLFIMPSFAFLSFAFIFTKAVDFSLFGILREMLYIPLSVAEKFQAKAVIDVFVHRSAKAVVSLAILGLNLWAGAECLSWLNPVAAGLLVMWIGIVWFYVGNVVKRPSLNDTVLKN